ncbi:bifunctional UDP-N-acetylglucosamine diphosphorylase/glucosamine-1-phosphate N-acetyltransferase GlmU [Chelativorans sp. Marseille-P2723]|uniref:bifunctional UDP-N-acetylglucosamine diphosphorylase/glucosamine-1-phosphate N-acetyltransferase GlmU n=1 Tax=Chelativorans sp. Marseille-P2723 TaxID=2709133 RepID=UPI00156D70A9|nr:bifunctional UDP-N-acetylglucosamine diphosphorylase/glucosamine-1-phosphate N-acetyltransferase GlmU [Chelativorans sp. Marseille-P2723]
MSNRTCLAVILAAGEGTRMKSSLPKVLHPIAGRAMLAHVMDAATAAGADSLAVVTGAGAELVRDAVANLSAPSASQPEIFVQMERLGTAHAVLAAREALRRGHDDVLVLFGDAPLLDVEAISAMRAALQEGAAIAVMGFRTDRPAGYGRLVERDGMLVAIREEKDCSPEELSISYCNGGAMAIAGRHALDFLENVGNSNAKGEYYLTDIVGIAASQGLPVKAVETLMETALGVNNRAELAAAEAIWQERRRREMMLSGVTLIAPETVFFSADTVIGADTIVEPNVWFGPGVTVEGGARIHAFCHIEDARIDSGATIGPFARLRGGCEVMEKAKIGSFCETKKTRIEQGAKVPHLSYIGDAVIGRGSNIGAGTVTCNYDGVSKHRTEIGAEAFIGTNSSLVAPVKVGSGAYVAAGSVVTEDAPDDSLTFGRARQVSYEGRGRSLRQKLLAAQKG